MNASPMRSISGRGRRSGGGSRLGRRVGHAGAYPVARLTASVQLEVALP